MIKSQYIYDFPENRKIASRLKKGAIKTLIDSTGYSERYIRMVLDGTRQNEVIINSACVIINSYDKMSEELQLIS